MATPKYGYGRAVLIIKYIKIKDRYKADGFSRSFKTLTDLKNYFNKTSAVQVKFIKGY